MCKHTHMCARSPIRLIWGMAQAPIRAYLPRDASTAAYLPMRAATTDSIRVLIGKAPSITQFFKELFVLKHCRKTAMGDFQEARLMVQQEGTFQNALVL